jgi:hypothetical protein
MNRSNMNNTGRTNNNNEYGGYGEGAAGLSLKGKL